MVASCFCSCAEEVRLAAGSTGRPATGEGRRGAKSGDSCVAGIQPFTFVFVCLVFHWQLILMSFSSG